VLGAPPEEAVALVLPVVLLRLLLLLRFFLPAADGLGTKYLCLHKQNRKRKSFGSCI
jgi:hypothetical protein